MEHLEAGVKLVEQGLTGAVKVIRHMQWAGGEGTKYLHEIKVCVEKQELVQFYKTICVTFLNCSYLHCT